MKFHPLEGSWCRVVTLEKKIATRQSAVSSTLSGLETIQSGPDHVAKPIVQRICTQGMLGSSLGPIRVVLGKLFDFFMPKGLSVC
jgi:hypothetical protein